MKQFFSDFERFLACFNFRFRTNAERLPGMEKVAIMEPDAKMLEYKNVPIAHLGPVGASPSSDFICTVFQLLPQVQVFSSHLPPSGPPAQLRRQVLMASRCAGRSALATSRAGGDVLHCWLSLLASTSRRFLWRSLAPTSR